MRRDAYLLLLLAVSGCEARATPSVSTATAHYLANAGVLVASGDTKIVFDPLFRNDFGTYQLLPEAIERALFAGEPPFDGLDAVLISHYHEDHFSPVDILRLLVEHDGLHLYAPAQAVAELHEIAAEHQKPALGRATAIRLEHEDEPMTIEAGELIVDAVRIPHAGWPTRNADVENIAFRVTLGAETTVVHLGDADTSESHYANDGAFWKARPADMAFPPYWYFGSEDGRRVLAERLSPAQSVGVHVPVAMPRRPEDRPPELEGFDLFVEPGETRDIPR